MIFSTTLLKKFCSNSLFNDTYRLSYEIKSKDVYEEFFEYKYLLDFSETISINFV